MVTFRPGSMVYTFTSEWISKNPPSVHTMAAPTASVRRLSSADAKRCDLYSGPTVIAPPENMKAPCDANGTATRLERARKSIDETASDRATPEVEQPDPSSTDKFAIAFDIDGVLLKGGKALPESIGAMKYINGDNPYGVRM
jgi:hypothetical protein